MSLRHRLQAWRELGRHYRQIFAYAWAQRHDMPVGLFRENEAEFLPAALSVQERPASVTARWTARVLMLMVLGLLLWSLLGHMDIVVHAQGRVIPVEHTKTVAAIETASVVGIHVQEGQSVRAGDVLLQLDTGVMDAEHDKALGERAEAVLALVRNEVLLAAVDRHQPPHWPKQEDIQQQYGLELAAAQWQAAQVHVQGQYADYQAKWKRLADDLRYYSAALPLAARQAASYRRLLATGDVSRDAWQAREQERMQISARVQETRNQQHALRQEVRRMALEHIADARRLAAAMQQDVRRTAHSSRLLTLTAPVDGTVQQLMVHTIGGVVQAAQPLMHIVPAHAPLAVEAMIENRDKGFVHTGQTVKVKVDAFEYTKYGTLSGRVQHISQDAVLDARQEKLNFAVRILLDSHTLPVHGVAMPVMPGMSVHAEIRTGERRVIEYVLSPLLRYQHEALTER